MIPLTVPYLTNEKIRDKANQFLHDTQSTDIPVDIEKIVEFYYKMDIVPIPDLQKLIDVEGFSTSDFTTIYVDNFVYENRISRYRFTLAHEIGHFILHHEYLQECNIDDLENWKQFINNIDPREHSKMEYQAYTFAGMILVPTQILHSKVNENIGQINTLVEQAKQNGMKKSDYLDYAIDNLASILAPQFDVSIAVLIRRIKCDQLDRMID